MMVAAMRTRIEVAYRRKHKSILQYIRAHDKSAEAAEEIMQDVFYGAMRNLNSLGGPIARRPIATLYNSLHY